MAKKTTNRVDGAAMEEKQTKLTGHGECNCNRILFDDIKPACRQLGMT
jgi:hypothetical protein